MASAANTQGIRIGADVGGTFTDIVIELPNGELRSTKVLTTTAAPDLGILTGIEQIAADAKIDLTDVSQVIHGTTLATNALIERRGASTALVTTDGFRDVIETRTESRFEQYDLNIELPKPLIERKDRYVVSERLDARGNVLLTLDESQANQVIEMLAVGGYQSVAVGFVHSYRNPDHERRFRDLLVERLPEISVSLSCEVSPQMREFERFNTVCANAYVQPLMASYVVRLQDQLRSRGVTCPLYLIHSGGGLMSVETATAFPVRLIESGPAGGAIFAADIAARYRRDRALSFDMGGTTAKISLIENFSPHTAKTFEVDRTARFKKGSGMPISIPVIEMIEIGAGGGSIASVDALGQIRIGPRSAGSDPGPAAYARGGTEATVTDADVELGRIQPDTFGAAGIDLSPPRAAAAIDASVGSALGADSRLGAIGISEMVDENMTNAARVHAVENGKDLTGYTMIAFGGAAPLHASRLLDKLGLDELLVPTGAGVGSAIGFLRAPFSYEAVRSFFVTTDNFDHDGVNRLLAELSAEAESFVRQGTDGRVTVQRQVSMRYTGQGWEIPVTLHETTFDQVAVEQLTTSFVKTYEEFFGRAIEDLPIEAVSWAVRVSSIQEDPPSAEVLTAPARLRTGGRQRDMYDPSAGETVQATIVERFDLSPGDGIAGPAIVVEPQTSTVVGSGHQAIMQPDRTLLICPKPAVEAAIPRTRNGEANRDTKQEANRDTNRDGNRDGDKR